VKRAWDEVARLERTNATHRKGWRLGDAAPATSIRHCRDELDELEAEPDNVDELADAVGCLFAYAAKKGWTMEDVESALLRKLAARFNVPAGCERCRFTPGRLVVDDNGGWVDCPNCKPAPASPRGDDAGPPRAG
jgi:hypothetical protein